MTTHDPCYEIGLVMAGAVSAGAYTAGVADFLIEALDAWEAAREADDPMAPPHRVRLNAISGASAGAMTAAIVAGIVAGRTHRPIATLDPGTTVTDNALFESWVNRIDATALLDTGDLRGKEQRLFSLLNGQVLDGIATMAVPDAAGGKRKSWIGDSLRLAFAVTNLRGVPYNLGFGDQSHSPAPRPGHSMRKHADLLRFRLGETGTPSREHDFTPLDWHMRGDGWTRLRAAALASGAFPLLLPPRRLDRPGSDYDTKLWAIPTAPSAPNADVECVRYDTLPPHWGEEETPAQFDFLAVDGGVLDNKPFAAARELLTGIPPTPPAGEVMGRVLITIDPFPDLVGYRSDETQPGGLLDVAMSLLAAMRNQTRFQPQELVTAFDDPYAGRQLMAPSRRVNGERMDHPLAGGAIDGFAGFLDRSFRLHDFWLGRANCQRFFRRHFRLPARHPLFDGWSPGQRQAYDIGDGTLPIVPLLADAAALANAPSWPRLPPERMDELRALLRKRTRALLPHAIDHLLAHSSRPMRWLTRVMAHFQSRGWVKALANHIEHELARRQQL